MQGFLKRTPRGRVAMAAAYQKIGAPFPSGPQGELL
jgi:holliday junction DNA helicase RuvB